MKLFFSILQTEAQSNLEAVTSETEQLREKIRNLEVDNDRLRLEAIAQPPRTTSTTTSPIQVEPLLHVVNSIILSPPP